MKTLLIIGFLIVIVWNLFAGLYYMLADSRPVDGVAPDSGRSKRTVNALTRRIGWSVALILLVIAGFATGLITPHGIG